MQSVSTELSAYKVLRSMRINCMLCHLSMPLWPQNNLEMKPFVSKQPGASREVTQQLLELNQNSSLSVKPTTIQCCFLRVVQEGVRVHANMCTCVCMCMCVCSIARTQHHVYKGYLHWFGCSLRASCDWRLCLQDGGVWKFCGSLTLVGRPKFRLSTGLSFFSSCEMVATE